MKKILLTSLFVAAITLSASAGDRILDFKSGCKIYRLDNKQWVWTDSSSMQGLAIPESAIIKNAPFTVFKLPDGTYGLSQKCMKDTGSTAAPQTSAPKPVGRRRAAATPAPARGDTSSPWTAVFGIGYNLSPSGTVNVVDSGNAIDGIPVKYSGSIAFLGEANYRANSLMRLSFELGLSQLQLDSEHGNEVSFFDFRPEFIFRGGPKLEFYIGPMLGIYFFSQNTEAAKNLALQDITLKQQTATTSLLGLNIGADYALNSQFDLGFFIRYFKPGTIKITGTNTATVGTFESKLSTSYITPGFRFAIHF